MAIYLLQNEQKNATIFPKDDDFNANLRGVSWSIKGPGGRPLPVKIVPQKTTIDSTLGPGPGCCYAWSQRGAGAAGGGGVKISGSQKRGWFLTEKSVAMKLLTRLGAGPCSGCGRRRGRFGHSCAIGQRRDEGATGTGNRNLLVQLCPDIFSCGSDWIFDDFWWPGSFPPTTGNQSPVEEKVVCLIIYRVFRNPSWCKSQVGWIFSLT